MMAAAQEPASRQAQPSGFFVLRTPLLPLATVTDWGRGLEAPACAADPAALEAAIAGDRLRLRSRLDELCSEPGFREAIFVASPSLEAAIDSWRKDPDGDRGQRAESSLVAYLMRAAARPTVASPAVRQTVTSHRRQPRPGRTGHLSWLAAA